MASGVIWKKTSNTAFHPRRVGPAIHFLADLGLGGEERIWPGQVFRAPTGGCLRVEPGHGLWLSPPRVLAAKGIILAETLFLSELLEIFEPVLVFAAQSAVPHTLKHGDVVAIGVSSKFV